MPRPFRDPKLRAVSAIVASALVFVTMTTLAKSLAASYHPLQLIWARYFFHVAVIVVLFPSRLGDLATAGPIRLHALRSGLLFLATAGNFVALSLMPLAEVSAIGFLTPLLVTVLSALVLAERVRPHRWAAVALGLIGAALIIRPGIGVFRPETLVAVGFASAYALYQVTTRIARETDAILALLWSGLFGMVVSTALVPLVWRMPGLPELVLMALIGLLGALAHLLVIVALRAGEASLVAAFSYTQLLWATLSGVLFFADLPDRWTILGALTIAAAGLGALHLDRRPR